MTPQDHAATAPPVPEKVPGRAHYSLDYIQGGRIFSFAHQIDTVIAFQPRCVLEVGVGAGIVAAALRAAGLTLTTLDVQPELKPDMVSSVTAIPAAKESFDVTLCAQVLEHLPFAQFRPALRELRRVTRQGLVLSLPDPTPHYFQPPPPPSLWRLLRPRTGHRFPSREYVQQRWDTDGHYWEIGFPGSELPDVEAALGDTQWHLLKTWRVPEFPYHRFFKLGAV
jgi:SAM-dependent methyltransferase